MGAGEARQQPGSAGGSRRAPAAKHASHPRPCPASPAAQPVRPAQDPCLPTAVGNRGSGRCSAAAVALGARPAAGARQPTPPLVDSASSCLTITEPEHVRHKASKKSKQQGDFQAEALVSRSLSLTGMHSSAQDRQKHNACGQIEVSFGLWTDEVALNGLAWHTDPTCVDCQPSLPTSAAGSRVRVPSCALERPQAPRWSAVCPFCTTASLPKLSSGRSCKINKVM